MYTYTISSIWSQEISPCFKLWHKNIHYIENRVVKNYVTVNMHSVKTLNSIVYIHFKHFISVEFWNILWQYIVYSLFIYKGSWKLFIAYLDNFASSFNIKLPFFLLVWIHSEWSQENFRYRNYKAICMSENPFERSFVATLWIWTQVMKA